MKLEMRHPSPISMIVRLVVLVALLLSASVIEAQTLVSSKSTWKYLDNGSNQGTAWRASSFSDSTWKTGTAQFGYGDGDEATVVQYGPDPKNRYITTYFRKSFSITDPSSIGTLTMRVIRDDGAVGYLNGTEAARI